MDATAIRWESLALVVGAIVLAIWALSDSTRDSTPALDRHARQFVFEVRRPGEQPQVVRLVESALIGRSPQCHIIFHDSTVSKEHARLVLDESRLAVEDLRSTNGTLVNGRAIDDPTTLKPGDRIALGSNVIWFLGEASPSDGREIL